MKIGALLFSIIPLLTNAQTHTDNSRKFYKLIQQQFKTIDSLHNDPNYDPDSFTTLSDRIFSIIEENKEVIFTLPDTVNFDLLYITKSSDKRFCLVSWDTRLGGTMIDFASIALYKADNKIYYKKQLMYYENGEADNPKMYYTNIYTLKTNSAVYLVRGFGQGSTALPWQQLKAFEIKDIELINPKIFPGNEYEVRVEFDTHSFAENERVPNIKIKDANKTILVPIPNDDEGFTGKYYTLKFDGKKFVRVQ